MAKLIVSLSINGNKAEDCARDHINLGNLILEEFATNPKFKEFLRQTGDDVSIEVVEALEPIRFEGFYMNQNRNSKIDPNQMYINLADQFKKIG